MLVRIALPLALIAAAGCGGEPDRPAPPSRPDLVLVTIDTLRADRVGRGLTPNLDALAARGLQFTEARATAPLTLPSHVSMLTGTLPPENGVRENGIHALRGEPASVARLLRQRGYRTGAIVGAYVLDRRFGLADGFDHYDDQIARDPRAVQRLEAERPANLVIDRALAWLRTAAPPAPIFLWVHVYDPHAPHQHSYDADVSFADAQIGRLLEEIRAAGRDPIVIATGDHGESLGEHGERTHGMLLYDSTLRVPLIVAGPGVPKAARGEPVSLVDIAATLASLAGASLPDLSGQARSLLDRAAGAARSDQPESYAETRYPRVAGWSPVYALTRDGMKLILSRGAELYDLAGDPAELHNLASTRAATVRAMAARLEALRSAKSDAGASVSPAAAAEKLRALGYVAGSNRAAPLDGPNPVEHIAAWGEFEAALADLVEAQSRHRALGRLQTLAAAYPDAPVFQSTYARVLADSGSRRAALDIYRRAVARWPDDQSLFHELAVTARGAGLHDEAVKAERAALALEPTMSSAHNGLALLMTDAGRHAEGAAAFEQAARHDPTNAEYWTNLGNARRALRQAGAAADAYRRAADLDPSNADAANGLAVLLVEQQRAAEAIPLLERAVAASPGFTEARLNLGIAYHETGQRDRAAAVYRDVVARAKRGSRERRAAADLLRSLQQ